MSEAYLLLVSFCGMFHDSFRKPLLFSGVLLQIFCHFCSGFGFTLVFVVSVWFHFFDFVFAETPADQLVCNYKQSWLFRYDTSFFTSLC